MRRATDFQRRRSTWLRFVPILAFCCACFWTFTDRAQAQPVPGSQIRPDFQLHDFDDRRVIHCVRCELSQASVPYDPANTAAPSEKDLWVYGDTVILTSDLINRGRDIRIWARQLEVPKPVLLDVSGTPGRRFEPGTPPPVQGEQGAAGRSGGAGGDGTAAGDVILMVHELVGALRTRAMGGDGGRGQDGGRGGRGTKGGTGRAASCNSRDCGRCTCCSSKIYTGDQGGQGGRGGPGGTGGRGGLGGPGGRFDLYISGELVPADREKCNAGMPSASTVTYCVRGGSQGPAGGAGSGGDGGPGGDGGGNRQWGGGRFGMTGNCCRGDKCREVSGFGPRGPGGAHGAGGQQGQAGSPGATGAILRRHPAALSQFAAAGSPHQWRMTLEAAELDYLHGRFAAAVDKLRWLGDLLSAAEPFTDVHWVRARPQLVDRAEMTAFRTRVEALQIQLASGLDFYGKPSHAVPLLSIGKLEETVGSLLSIADIVQREWERYWQQNASREQRLAALDATRSEAENLMQRIDAELRSAATQQQEAETNVATLAEVLDRQQDLLVRQYDSFLTAVRVRLEYERDAAVLRTFGSVLGLSLQAGNQFRLIREHGKHFDSSKTRMDRFAYGISVLNGTVTGVRDLKRGYEQIRDTLDSAASPDAAKLVLDQQHLDEMIETFISWAPDAGEQLRPVVQQYFALVDQRNRAVLDLDALYQRSLDLEAERQTKQQELQRIAALRTGEHDPQLPEYVGFMANTYSDLREKLLRYLHQENRAFEYWTLTERSFDLTGTALGQLAGAHATLIDEVRREMERIGRASELHWRPLVVRREDYPLAFELFEQTGVLTVSLPIGAPRFDHLVQTTIDRVRIRVPGASTDSGFLGLRLSHAGAVSVRGEGGREFAFVHAPILNKAYEVDLETGDVQIEPVLGGGRDFIGVSPFTTWRLDFNVGTNQGLDRGSIEQVTFEFWGHARTFGHLQDQP